MGNIPVNLILKGDKIKARVVKNKQMVNTRLAANYGDWMYCDQCNENIGYLCYATYDKLKLDYKCHCGSNGSVFLDFVDSKVGQNCDDDLIIIKNRFCCPKDNEPLITILDKKIESYEMEITCKSCSNIYKKQK